MEVRTNCVVGRRSNSIISARVRDGKVTLTANLEKFIGSEIQSVEGKRMDTHNCSPIWTTAAKSVPSIYVGRPSRVVENQGSPTSKVW